MNKSKFRIKSFEELKSVNLLSLSDEVKKIGSSNLHCYSCLSAICQRKLNAEERKASVRSAVAFGLLINNINKNTNAIQRLISILLYKEKARVKVNNAKYSVYLYIRTCSHDPGPVNYPGASVTSCSHDNLLSQDKLNII